MKRISRIAATTAAMTLTLGAGTIAPALAAPRTAEPDVAALVSATLKNQKINWENCTFDGVSEAMNAKLQSTGVQCASITVPMNWHDAKDGRTITVRISKAKASGTKRGVMLFNPGGPGGDGLIWGPYMHLKSPEIGAKYDTVGFDPRGVGQSTNFDCTYRTDGTTQVQQAKDYAEGCLANELAPYISTWQTVHDMDFIRFLLGETKISYLGYSYGTWLGAYYMGTFPSKADRFVLDSATDLTERSLEKTWDIQPASRDRQFQDRFLPWVARNHDTIGLGKDPMAIRARFEGAGGFDNYVNLLFGFSKIIQSFYDNSKYPEAAKYLKAIVMAGDGSRQDLRAPFGTDTKADSTAHIEALRKAINDLDATPELKAEMLADLEAASPTLDQAIATKTAAAAPNVKTENGVFDAIRCNDGQWTTNVNVWKSKLTKLWREAPLTSQLQSIPACAFWPSADKGMPDLNKVATSKFIIVQSEYDAATPYEGGYDSMKTYKNAYGISVDNEGSHGLFPYGTECVDDPIYAYLLYGSTPGSKFTGCGGLPLPLETETFQTGGYIKNGYIAKHKMTTVTVAEANEMVAILRKSAGIPDIPGTSKAKQEAVKAALPVGA